MESACLVLMYRVVPLYLLAVQGEQELKCPATLQHPLNDPIFPNYWC